MHLSILSLQISLNKINYHFSKKKILIVTIPLIFEVDQSFSLQVRVKKKQRKSDRERKRERVVCFCVRMIFPRVFLKAVRRKLCLTD